MMSPELLAVVREEARRAFGMAPTEVSVRNDLADVMLKMERPVARRFAADLAEFATYILDATAPPPEPEVTTGDAPEPKGD